MLKHVRNVPYHFTEDGAITPDYGACVRGRVGGLCRGPWAMCHLALPVDWLIGACPCTWYSTPSALSLPFIITVPPSLPIHHQPTAVLGASTCCLYISLRYHLLEPNYLIRRVKELRRCVILSLTLSPSLSLSIYIYMCVCVCVYSFEI